MEAKHTPGPWRCACDSYGKVRHSKKKCVYTTITRPGGDELVNIVARIPNWGDAYLIAAAPDLLAALRAIVARINGVWDDLDLMSFGELLPDTEADIDDIEIIASQAIAKAKGPPC